MKYWLKRNFHHYRDGKIPAVVVFASPRGGGTWITEMIGCIGKSWIVHEPFNVRSQFVRRELGVERFSELYDPANLDSIEGYFQKILEGRFTELRVWPWERGYSFNTNRIIVKLNQALLNRMDWFVDRFSIYAVHLTRHPIAVARSRVEFPLLNQFKNCQLRDEFDREELALADKIILSDDRLEQGVLAWCLHHGPALRAESSRNSLLTSYEQCVLQPEETFADLLSFLGRNDELELVLRASKVPSSVIRKSDAYTQSILGAGYCPEEIVGKWRNHVSPSQEKDLLSILKVFKIDRYVFGQDLPVPISRSIS